MNEEGLAIMYERKKRGWKQYDLAALIGINPSAVSEFETGRRRLGPHIRRQLVELGFPIAATAPRPIDGYLRTTADGREVFRV